jgi:mRNA interferase MazF
MQSAHGSVAEQYVMQPFKIRLLDLERRRLTVPVERGHDEIGDVSRCERSHLTCSTTRTTGPRAAVFSPRWTRFVRGDIHRLHAPKSTRGHEQQGNRYAVVLQSDDLMLSTVLVAPTSRSSAPRIFRPTITIGGDETQVLIEQTSAVAHERLGEFVGRLRHDDLEAIDEALRLVLELD